MSRASLPKQLPQPMPGNVRSALVKRALMDAYRARPDYQQHDYLKWIATALGEAAKQKRLDQMLDELQHGGLFKGAPWTPPAPVTPATSAAKS
jgi:hypothetical protein